MARINLTDKRCEAAEAAPKGARYHLWDDTKRGLGLRVTDTGAKSWIVMKRPKGQAKVKRITIGAYPAVTLKRARELAKDYLDDLDEGVDPTAKREAEAQAEARRAEGMVDKALDDYEAAEVEQRRTAREIKRMFKVYVRPRWTGRHLYDLRRLDVLKLRDEVGKGNGRVIADRVLEALNAFFKWWGNRDEAFRSPMPPIWRLVKRADLMRDRALDDDEIRALWAAAGAVEPAMYGSMVKLLLITGQRLGDWQRARWDEIADEALVIPAARYKGAREHAVPIVLAARAILDTLPRTGPFVFQIRKGPFANLSKAKARLDALMPGVAAFRLHDLRRTARSLLSRAGVERTIAERLIGHSVGDHVERTYDTYGYWPERVKAAQALANLVERIVAGTAAQVIQIGSKRRSVGPGA